jgi:hypothetical protein
MIDAREYWTQQKKWPTQTKFIGTAGIREDHNVRNYQRDCRFYIYDNTWQAVDRIMATRYLKQCYEEGYTKDVVFTGPNCYGRNGVRTY